MLQASRYQNRHLDLNAIETQISSKASQLCWWPACREALAELKRRFRDAFVPDPNQSVIDETTAREHICGWKWFAKLATEAGRSSVADVHALLTESHSTAQASIADGTWPRGFHGEGDPARRRRIYV